MPWVGRAVGGLTEGRAVGLGEGLTVGLGVVGLGDGGFVCPRRVGRKVCPGIIILVVGPAEGRGEGLAEGLTVCPGTVGKRVAPGNCIRFDGDTVGTGEGLQVCPRTVGWGEGRTVPPT